MNSNEYMREYMRNHHNEQRSKALEYLGGKCKCGSKKDLHFHHQDPSTKEFTISDGLKFGWERLVVELDKCILLC